MQINKPPKKLVITLSPRERQYTERLFRITARMFGTTWEDFKQEVFLAGLEGDFVRPCRSQYVASMCRRQRRWNDFFAAVAKQHRTQNASDHEKASD